MHIKKVGVVIVTYNSKKYIESCLDSVLNSNTPLELEIVIIDNASTDTTVRLLQKRYPTVCLFQNQKNLGFGAGINIGLRHLLKKGGFDYILFLNPDTLVLQDLIEELIKPYTFDRNIGVTGPIITYVHKKSKIWFAGGYFNKLFCFSRHPFMDKDTSTVHIKSGKTDFMRGCCMMIKREVIDNVGLFDEKYFLYFEDVFFSMKVRKLGYTCHLVAKPLVSHLVSAFTGEAGSNRMTPLRSYYFARNPLLYIRGEVRGFFRLSNIFGQLFIRLPYYSFQCHFISYLKGLRDGFLQIL